MNPLQKIGCNEKIEQFIILCAHDNIKFQKNISSVPRSVHIPGENHLHNIFQ